MKKMSRNFNRSGFTLVEMVVVISIIGALSAIIIPSVINYVRKANRAADKVTARLIGTSLVQLMIEDETFASNYYKTVTLSWSVSIDGNKYVFKSVARADGSKSCYGNDPTENKNNNKKSGAGWEFTSYADANVDVVKKMNSRISDVIGGNAEEMSFIPMRSSGYHNPITDRNHDNGKSLDEKAKKRTSDPTFSYTDKWIIGYNAGKKGNENGQLEVWAGDSYGKSATGPRVRLWPSPPSYY